MKQLLVAVFLFVAFIGRASAVEGWTGEIKWINVDEQGAAYIFIDNPRDGPKPAMTCGQYDIVYLGTKNQPVNPAFGVSQANTCVQVRQSKNHKACCAPTATGDSP